MTISSSAEASASTATAPRGATNLATGMRGYRRNDGRLGIRNYIVVAYLVECAHHVARRIVEPYQESGVQLIGFPGCYPSGYANRVLDAMCTHPNVAAVLLVSPALRPWLSRFLRFAVPNLKVLAYNEVPDSRRVKLVAAVGA